MRGDLRYSLERRDSVVVLAEEGSVGGIRSQHRSLIPRRQGEMCALVTCQLPDASLGGRRQNGSAPRAEVSGVSEMYSSHIRPMPKARNPSRWEKRRDITRNFHPPKTSLYETDEADQKPIISHPLTPSAFPSGHLSSTSSSRLTERSSSPVARPFTSKQRDSSAPIGRLQLTQYPS